MNANVLHCWMEQNYTQEWNGERRVAHKECVSLCVRESSVEPLGNQNCSFAIFVQVHHVLALLKCAARGMEWNGCLLLCLCMFSALFLEKWRYVQLSTVTCMPDHLLKPLCVLYGRWVFQVI